MRCAVLNLFAALAVIGGCSGEIKAPPLSTPVPKDVEFWHVWGGAEADVVRTVVKRFNTSQQRFHVRAVAMPGNNLDLKFFLSVAGGDAPDLLNHQLPIVADWAQRGVLTPLDELADAQQMAQLEDWLFPAARRLGGYHGRLYALCNGLDVRALYYNKSLLDEHGLSIPRTVDELDLVAETIAPPQQSGPRNRMGFVPDPRRLWAWGIVFGGRFFDPEATTPESMITADSPEIVRALQWMAGYSQRYGTSELAAFRSGEQALTGSGFTMLRERLYAVTMDGQWRVRDISTLRVFAEKNRLPFDEYVVAPLPTIDGGRQNAGWINGKVFVIPRDAKNREGAWEFAKFWAGFGGNERYAAMACASGGWIPVSQAVVDQSVYEAALRREPMLRQFVELAASENQIPTPTIPAASYYVQQINQAAEQLLVSNPEGDAQRVLQDASDRVRARLQETLDEL